MRIEPRQSSEVGRCLTMTSLSNRRSRCDVNLAALRLAVRVRGGKTSKTKRPDLWPGRLALGVPDNDLLSRGIPRTIIGVLPFHGPVRDGKEWFQQANVVRR